MKIACPSCENTFPSRSINVQADIAHCERCGETYRVSEILGPSSAASARQDARISAETLAKPPKGAWFRETMDGYEAGASLRSPIAFFLVPFTLVWAGGSLGGIYGTQIAEGEFDLFRTLFGIPFLIGSVFLIFFTLATIWGKIVVTVAKSKLKVFTGIGWIGRVKEVTLESISDIYEDYASQDSRRGRARSVGKTIVVEGDRRVTLTGLSEDRGYFILNALRFMCLGK